MIITRSPRTSTVCASLVAVVSAFCILPSALGQGALTPPGAPTPTMKSLDQVEPRIPISSAPALILNPGSYYLTTNLIGTANQNGISVLADNVTIDLNGLDRKSTRLNSSHP